MHILWLKLSENEQNYGSTVGNVQVVVSGILRGSGMQRTGAIVIVLCHVGVGLPLAVWLGFSKGMGVLGMCTGECFTFES